MGLGTYRNFAGVSVGTNFSVIQLAGRDRSGAPVWRVRCCKCGFVQPFAHSQLKNASESGYVLFCRNARCTYSKPEPVKTETLADMLRAEQRQEQLLKQQEAQLKAEADKKAAAEAALRAERARWMRYANTQIVAGAELEDILPFDRWLMQSETWKTNVLGRVGIAE